LGRGIEEFTGVMEFGGRTRGYRSSPGPLPVSLVLEKHKKA